MKEERVGLMRLTADGLRDLAQSIDNIYSKKNCIITMPIWIGDDGLYMQLAKGSGFINLVKYKMELGQTGKKSSPINKKSPIIEKNEIMNFLRLIRYHKKHCDGECVVSLCLIRQMLEKLGAKFTEKEKELFI